MHPWRAKSHQDPGSQKLSLRPRAAPRQASPHHSGQQQLPHGLRTFHGTAEGMPVRGLSAICCLRRVTESPIFLGLALPPSHSGPWFLWPHSTLYLDLASSPRLPTPLTRLVLSFHSHHSAKSPLGSAATSFPFCWAFPGNLWPRPGSPAAAGGLGPPSHVPSSSAEPSASWTTAPPVLWHLLWPIIFFLKGHLSPSITNTPCFKLQPQTALHLTIFSLFPLSFAPPVYNSVKTKTSSPALKAYFLGFLPLRRVDSKFKSLLFTKNTGTQINRPPMGSGSVPGGGHFLNYLLFPQHAHVALSPSPLQSYSCEGQQRYLNY